MSALGYPGAKMSLKEDDVPKLFPVVEAMLMPLIHRTSTTTTRLGSKRTISELSARTHVMSANGEFAIFWRVRPANLVTSASEHNEYSDLS